MSELSFHQRHTELLRILTGPDAMDSILTRVAERSESTEGSTWARVWGRLLDPQVGRARLLYQATNSPTSLCTLDIGGPHGAEVSFVDHDVGPVAAQFFPADPGLPTLLATLLRYPDAQVVRYRPGKRCTLRRNGSGDYLKVFPDDRANRMQAEGEQLWQAAKRGAIAFSVARPLGFNQALRSYTQAEVAGVPIVDELFRPGGTTLAGRLGEVSATITTSGLKPMAKHNAAVEMRRTRRRGDQILSFAPGLAGPLADFLKRLERLHGELTPAPLRPIHGSSHPKQWLVDGSDLGLVDFDRLSLGDPELDVATFTAEVDFEADANRHEVIESFEQGYRLQFGNLDQKRLDLYRAHKRLAKVHRTISAIRVDGDLRAEAHLETAAKALSSTGGSVGSC